MKEDEIIAKRYYWLKLKKDFFKQPEIMLLENSKNGREFLLFYLKLLLLGLEGDGTLRTEEGKPFTVGQLAVLTETDPIVAKNAFRRFNALGLASKKDADLSVFLPKLETMVGSETTDAMRKRLKKAELFLSEKKEQRKFSGNFPQSKSIEKETEKESDQELKLESEVVDMACGSKGFDFHSLAQPLLSKEEIDHLIGVMGFPRLERYMNKIDRFVAERGVLLNDPYKTILEWYHEDRGA